MSNDPYRDSTASRLETVEGRLDEHENRIRVLDHTSKRTTIAQVFAWIFGPLAGGGMIVGVAFFLGQCQQESIKRDRENDARAAENAKRSHEVEFCRIEPYEWHCSDDKNATHYKLLGVSEAGDLELGHFTGFEEAVEGAQKVSCPLLKKAPGAQDALKDK